MSKFTERQIELLKGLQNGAMLRKIGWDVRLVEQPFEEDEVEYVFDMATLNLLLGLGAIRLSMVSNSSVGRTDDREYYRITGAGRAMLIDPQAIEWDDASAQAAPSGAGEAGER